MYTCTASSYGYAVCKLWDVNGVIVIIINFQLGGIFSSREQKFYASAGAVAEEVLSMVHTIVMFGGEQRESKRLIVGIILRKKNIYYTPDFFFA